MKFLFKRQIFGNVTLTDIVMGVLFSAMWGSAFTSARIIVEHAPPLTISALRFFCAGIIAVVIARILGQSWNLNARQWRATALIGFCQNTLYLGLTFVGMQWIEASLATVLACILPLLVTLLERVLFNERIRYIGILGLFLGCCGVALIMGYRISNEVDLRGVAFCIVGVFALAAATLALREASSGTNILMIVGIQMLIGATILTILSLCFEDWHFNWTLNLALAFSYSVIAPGLVATWIWFSLVARIGAIEASTFHFLNPFFGVAIAALILGETITHFDYIGVVIISLGILFVQVSKR